MAGKTSKNSRNSRSGSAHAQQSAFGNLIIPTGAGEFAYVMNPADGTNVHVKLTSESFTARMADGTNVCVKLISDSFTARIAEVTAAGHGAKVLAEVTDLSARYPGTDWQTAEMVITATGVAA